MQSLYNFVRESFSPEEFDRLIWLQNGFGAGASAVRDETPPPSTTPAATYFYQVLVVLKRRGALGDRFFAALRIERPLLAATVQRLEAEHRPILSDSTGTAQAPSLTVAVRPSRLKLVVAAAISLMHDPIVDSKPTAPVSIVKTPDDSPCPAPTLLSVPSLSMGPQPSPALIPMGELPPPTRAHKRVRRPETQPVEFGPIPALPATISASTVQANIAPALLDLGPGWLKNLSFTARVLPGGHIDRDSLKLSPVYGSMKHRIHRALLHTRLPPSLLGSSNLICNVIHETNGEAHLECRRDDQPYTDHAGLTRRSGPA